MEEKHAHNVVITFIHSPKVHQGVDAGCERAVQPPSSLANKLWCSFWNIGLALRGLNVCQVPFTTSSSNQLETEDPVLGQEHVLLENVHIFNSFASVHFRCCMVTMKVLRQRSPHNGAEPVCGKGTRENAHVSEGALQRFIQDIADLILKVLGCYEWIEEISPTFAQHGMDLSASTAKILVVIESFPKGKK